MPFGEPVDAPSPAQYQLDCRHTIDQTIGIKISVNTGDSGGTPEEADAIFQELIDLLSSKPEIVDLVASKTVSVFRSIEATPTEEPA